MKIDSIINFLLVAGAVQGFLFNFVTLTIRRKHGPAIIYLNLVVLFISLNNLQAWLPEAGYSSGSYFIKQLIVPWYLLVFPCFYSFVRHFLGIQDKIKGYVKIAFILFAVQVLIRSILIFWVMQSNEPDPDAIIEKFNVLEELVNIIFSLYVFVLAFILMFRKTALYKEILDYDDVRWIKIFLFLGIAIALLWSLGLTLRAIKGFEDGAIYYPLRLATSLLLYWISYQGLYRYTLVQDRVQVRRGIRSNKKRAVPTTQISNSSLEEKHARDYESVRDYILSSQQFLDPLFSLKKLAEEFKVSPGHLSRLINKYGNKNFTDFINEFRVEQAKKIIRDPDFQNYTIVAIGLECGFNSKSTFYSAFKKFTSQSPSEYKSQG
ncbi:helix-turn-helix domain-containing protein [Lentiprolixibacter aurantiacus]|uniref:Helix-turn-helix transcriptional regulator n=1 Tax=Lentiprolixibacter aurantiacus TaxID=2993939 RepID=A0AAE3MIR6_9FLAO|nr:helix-turn-helix transcriptional regulator [Lentiprolixibacter aurantiacus]MCX2718445.1 helix-turn-helix transcriptional regulator [Lentiprolixibacter aurantiacus]